MPQPEGAALHHNFNPILTSLAQGLLRGLTSQFIARQIFPNLPVAIPNGMYTKWNRGDFMRRTAKKLANMEPVPLGGFGTGEGSFKVDTYGLGTNWTAKDLANARAAGTSEADFIGAKNLYVVRGCLLELEIQTAALVQTAANWGTAWTGVNSGPTANQFIKWSQGASDPVDNMDQSKKVFRDTIGFDPNTLVMSEDIYFALRKNANLIDRIKYGGTMDRPTQVTMDQIKMLFEMDRIFVPTSRYNTAKEGAADAFSPVWNNVMWLGYTTDTPSPDQPSAGYHFSWTGDTANGLPRGVADETGAGPQAWDAVRNDEGIFIRRFRENRPNAEFLEGELFTTPQVVAKDLGMTWTDVV